MSELDRIDEDVWRPFRNAYATLGLEQLAGILAPEFVRVERAASWIGDRDAYLARTGEGFARAAERGDTLAIDFRFDERLVGDGLAYESGTYRVTITDEHGASQRFLGRFDTVLRRAPDGWRMVLDQDGDVDSASLDEDDSSVM